MAGCFQRQHCDDDDDDEPSYPPSRMGPADRPSTFMSTLKVAFPQGVNYIGGFELKEPRKDPRLPIDLILVTGAWSPAAQDVCEHFVTDFDYFHIDVNDHLDALSKQALPPLHEALCLVHPEYLQRKMAAGEGIPSPFLVAILRYRVALVMEDQESRILLSSFPSDAKALVELTRGLAPIGAVLHFEQPKRKDSKDMRIDEEALEGVSEVLTTLESPIVRLAFNDESDEAEVSYKTLLAAIVEGAHGNRRMQGP